MRGEAGEGEEAISKPIRGIFVGCCASAGKPRAMSITTRAKLPRFRLFIYLSDLTHGCACFVPKLGQNIHLPLPKKKQLASKWLGFLVSVWFWSALSLTLN